MATSSSWNYSLTAANLIQASLEDLGVITPGATVASADSTLALRRLNLIVKQYQARSDSFPGLKIHTRQRVTLLLAKGQQTYLIGPASTDSRASTAMGRTTVATAYSSGTSLVVAAASDTTTYPGTTISMANSDIIGVELDNGTIAYTTISSISGAPTITLAGALGSAAAVGNYVWWFTSRAQRLPFVEAAVLRNENRIDTELGIYTDVREYDIRTADKYADGAPTMLLIEPLVLNTRVTLNSQPTNVTDQIILTGFYPAEDYDATTDDIAFPQEAYRFLSWELAFALAPSYGVTWTPTHELSRKEAKAMYANVNIENSVLFFQPGGL